MLWLTLWYWRPRLFWRPRLLRRRLRLSGKQRSTTWRKGFWSAQVGSGTRAAGEETRGKRRSPGSGGALRLPFRSRRGCEGRHAPVRAPVVRVSRRVPRRGHWREGASAGVTLCLPLVLGGLSPFLPAQARNSSPAPQLPRAPSASFRLKPLACESPHYPSATRRGKLTGVASPDLLPRRVGGGVARFHPSPIRGPGCVICVSSTPSTSHFTPAFVLGT